MASIIIYVGVVSGPLRKILSTTFMAVLILASIALKSVVMAQQPPTNNNIAEATDKLFKAIQNNNLSGVRTAIAIGANTAAINEWGMTAADLAVEKGYFDIAHFLLSVRNMRSSESNEAPLSPSKKLQPSIPAGKTPPAVKNQRTVPVRQVPAETEKPPTPWPADKPNPFDPNTAVAGSSLPIIGKVKEAARHSALPSKKISGFPTAPKRLAAPITKSVSANASYAKQGTPTNAASTPVAVPKQSGFFGRVIDSVIPDWIKGDNETDASTPAPDISIAGPATQAPAPVKAVAPPPPAPIMAKVKAPSKTAVPVKAKVAAPAPAPTPAAPVPPTPARTPAPAAPTPLATDRAPASAAPARATATRDNKIEPQPKPLKAEIRQPEAAPAKISRSPKPATQPQADKAEAAKGNTSIFDKLSNLLLSDKYDAKPNVAKGTTKVVSKIPPPPAKPAKTASPPTNYLSGVELAIGESARLGQPLKPKKLSLIKKPRASRTMADCIRKKQGSLAFCIEAVNWPEKIKSYFTVNSVIYRGKKTVVRYDNGIATFFHTLFPSQSFKVVTSYYQRILGPPSNIWKRSIAPLAAPRRENPTYIWKSINPVTKQVTSLEIRKFDDARGGFPDTSNGVIMLYGDSSLPVFPQLSVVETMLINSNARLK